MSIVLPEKNSATCCFFFFCQNDETTRLRRRTESLIVVWTEPKLPSVTDGSARSWNPQSIRKCERSPKSCRRTHGPHNTALSPGYMPTTPAEAAHLTHKTHRVTTAHTSDQRKTTRGRSRYRTGARNLAQTFQRTCRRRHHSPPDNIVGLDVLRPRKLSEYNFISLDVNFLLLDVVLTQNAQHVRHLLLLLRLLLTARTPPQELTGESA